MHIHPAAVEDTRRVRVCGYLNIKIDQGVKACECDSEARLKEKKSAPKEVKKGLSLDAIFGDYILIAAGAL